MVDNPLDKIGDAAKNVGDGAGGFLHGIARFLEQVTGNATQAAIFAFFLLFALSLIKSATLGRNALLYGSILRKLGKFLTLAPFVIATLLYPFFALIGYSAGLQFGMRKDFTASELLIDFSWLYFSEYIPSMVAEFKWYILVFITMWSVGILIERTSKQLISIKSPEKTPEA